MERFSELRSIRRKDESAKYFKPKQSEYKRLIESIDDEEKTPVVNFFSKIFESKEVAHVFHLQVKGEMGSHAKHTALQEYYDGDVTEILDDLIEMYQGQFGEIVEGYQIIDTTKNAKLDPIQYFTDLAEFIKEERYNCFDETDTHYFNLIDDLLVIIYKLLYKLKFTK